jgi:hypothetical protein
MGNTRDTDTPGQPIQTSEPSMGQAGVHGVDVDIDRALIRAWSLAVSHPDLWREEIWPLIFAVENARQDGEVDPRAEEALLRITGRLWAFT